MKQLWWIGLCVLLTLGLTACEADEGSGDTGVDGGADTGGGDTGGDTDDGVAYACGDQTLFDTSCLSTFFACYDVAGTCTTEIRDPIGDTVVTAVVWSNGAEMVYQNDDITRILGSTTHPSGGGLCASATGTDTAGGDTTLDYTQPAGNDTLQIFIDGSGNMAVTCPDNSEETYTSDQRVTLMQCAGFSCGSDDLIRP